MGNSSSTKGSGSGENSVPSADYTGGGAPQSPQSGQRPETVDDEEVSHLLLKACLNGDLDDVKGLLSQGAPVSPVEVLDPLSYDIPPSSPTSASVAKRNFISPLIAAITGAQLEVVQHLVSAGCSINQSFQQYSESNGSIVTGVTPIMLACQRKHKGVIAFLLAAKADCSAVDSDRNTILHYVCRHQQQKQLQVSLGSGRDLSEGDDITNTLLLLQDFSVLSADISRCSNIRNNTPLHSLAYFNNYAAMLLLLEVSYGARPGVSEATAAQYECNDDHFVKYPPPSPNLSTLLKNNVGMTPLHIAVLRKAPRMVRLLLDFAFDPGAQERSGLDVFQLAKVVSIQQSTKDTNCDDFINCQAIVHELEAYSTAVKERQLIESIQEDTVMSVKEEEESLECDFDMNSSSITFDNTVDEIDEKGTESTSSLKDDYYYRTDVSRSACLTDHKAGSGGTPRQTPRQVHPYPKAKKLSRQQLLGAAHDILSGESTSPRSAKKKKKPKKRAKSPKKRQISPQKSRQFPGKGAPFLCGTQPRSTSPRKTPAATSPRRLGSNNSAFNAHSDSSRVTPAKHSRTAHSSVVHRGETAANMLSSSRHLRARSGWPTTPGANRTKVAPSPSTQRSHRGAKGSRTRAAVPTASAASSAAMKLPAHIHTSPSGILTITFS
mmetsp:Transcript_14439/g.23908  ORF Transcript_14439/g.23908 Transcript_14439/m.23908 type:complete len:663 (+) Transcript_14439:122-2110(+)